MAFMPGEIIRLLREKWPDATTLAEELFAILNSDVPIKITSPVQIDNPRPTGPSLTINDGGFNDSIVVNKQPMPAFSFPPFPPIPPFPAPNSQAGLSFTLVLSSDGTFAVSQGQAGQPKTTQAKPDTGGGGGFPGKVVSGSADTYLVDVYEQGLAKAPTQRTVTQLQIDPAETIPADTWAMIGKAGTGYFMQVPVWL